MSIPIKKTKPTISIQLEVPLELHDNIIRFQSLNKLKGIKATIPETCNGLLTVALSQNQELLKTPRL